MSRLGNLIVMLIGYFDHEAMEEGGQNFEPSVQDPLAASQDDGGEEDDGDEETPLFSEAE